MTHGLRACPKNGSDVKMAVSRGKESISVITEIFRYREIFRHFFGRTASLQANSWAYHIVDQPTCDRAPLRH